MPPVKGTSSKASGMPWARSKAAFMARRWGRFPEPMLISVLSMSKRIRCCNLLTPIATRVA